MEKNPEYQFYPLFRKFESWCQDENRHGDFFKALLRSQPQLWNNWRSRLWVRFFLITVFATHTMTVFERGNFYEILGIHPRQYNTQVVEETNKTAAKAFPIILNTNHPYFFWYLEQCAVYNQKIIDLNQINDWAIAKFIQKIPLTLMIFWYMFKLFLIKPIDTEATRKQVC
jgi:magnesium-protoporphyrin IX monomethyl ester (oxidative) cyclase